MPATLAAARILAAGDDGAAGNPRFVVVEGTALPFAAGSFRSVLYLSALHELADRGSSLTEAHRVLGPGGTLAVGEDEATWHRMPLSRDIEAAGLRPEGEEHLPEVFNHGVASAYVVRSFSRD